MTALAVLLVLMSCQKGGSASKSIETDSLRVAAENMVHDAATAGDVERTFHLADSLLGQNRLTPIKADFYKSFVYYCRDEGPEMVEYLKKIIDKPGRLFRLYAREMSRSNPFLFSGQALLAGNLHMVFAGLFGAGGNFCIIKQFCYLHHERQGFLGANPEEFPVVIHATTF